MPNQLQYQEGGSGPGTVGFGQTSSGYDNTLPNFDDIVNAGKSNSALFGQTPGQTETDFGNAYSSAVNSYSPFPSDRTEMDQLQSVYNNVPAAFDTSATVASMNAARQSALTTGTQAANNASQKFQQSQIPGSSNATGAAMIRAQSLLPFMNADTTAAGNIGQYQDTAKQGALAASAGIATTLANLEATYNQSLANYNSSKASFGLGYANDQTQLGLQASQFNTTSQLGLLENQEQIQEQQNQAAMSNLLGTKQLNASMSQAQTAQQMQAANSILAEKAPSGAWTTNNDGSVSSGQSSYNAYQAYLSQLNGAKGVLSGLA